MSELQQIERRIEQLSPKELAEFRSWFVEFDARVWDDKIAADLDAGRLDNLIAEALADYKAGKAREL